MSLEIFDSTLRDGAQCEGVSFSVSDKISVVRTLDEFGVDYIEAGNPGSNPKDMEFFLKAKDIKLRHARLVAFGSTRRKGVSADQDANLQALLKAGTDTVTIFGKASKLHIKEVLNITYEENLRIVYDSVAFLKSKGKEVIFDAEHFFDGYKLSPSYAISVLNSAQDAGADVICLCDTNGGTLPMDIFEITKQIKGQFKDIRIGIHCHNDIGCGVANTLLAVEAGATHVQGTFIGIGERAGNADLGVILPSLKLKTSQGRGLKIDVSRLSGTVAKLYDICNLIEPSSRPYTGSSAFAHKGGMHIDGVSKVAASFEHISPEQVGNKRRLLLSEMGGRTTLLSKIKDIAPDLTKDSPKTQEILQYFKQLEHQGYQFEAAEASFELRVMSYLNIFKPHFKWEMYKTSGEYPSPSDQMTAYALVKVSVNGETETSASLGNGPVNALDLALRKALNTFYPKLSSVHLTDYKVRVLSADATTGSKVRVLIETTNGLNSWTTIGVSTDIIEASSIALADAIEYFLYKFE